MTDDPRVSDEGYVAGLAGGAALLFALLAAAAGESGLVVVLALLAGVLGVGLAVRDATVGREPAKNDFLPLAALAAGAAIVSVPAERWFSVAGLGLVALMALGRGYGWRVADTSSDAGE